MVRGSSSDGLQDMNTATHILLICNLKKTKRRQAVNWFNHFQVKTSNIHWLQLLKSRDLLLFFDESKWISDF